MPVPRTARTPHLPAGLRGRTALAAVTLVLVTCFVFALLVAALLALRSSAREARRSQEIVSALNRYENTLVDMQSGHRYFAITGDSVSLAQWRAAVADLPRHSRRVADLLADQPAQLQTLARATAQANAFRDEWSRRIVALARRDPIAARVLIGTGEGSRRVESVRRHLRALAAEQEERAESRRIEADRNARLVLGVAGGGLIWIVALIAGFAVALRRGVIRPVERLAVGTRRIAAGERDVRVPPEGAAEVAELGAAFNRMAETIDATTAGLEEQRAEREAVLNATADAICMTDVRGRLLFTNVAMSGLWRELGLRDEGSIWERIAELAQLTPEPRRYAEIFAGVARDSGAFYEAEFEVVPLARSFVGMTGPVLNADRDIIGRIFTLRETTAERAADRLKEEFVATVSHELRTPLTSLAGFLDIVLDEDAGPLTDDQQRFLGIARRSTERLTRLVGDLLFVARADAGRLELDLADVDLAALLTECGEEVRALAQYRALELAVEVDAPLRVYGDAARLSQLVHNLLGNAIKFTPEGGRVTLRGAPDGGDAVIDVMDTGSGISEDDQERIFERFFRTNAATAQAVSGTGLGLSIAKAIAEAHGGTIDVESEEGAGTTFRIRLPLYAAG